jgi:L-ascorbate metabolism protein UlaG (beta-lactamase superfamily)
LVGFKTIYFRKNPRVQPPNELPVHKTDLHNLDRSHDALVWFGHSSYFMQIDGKRILVDPVLSGSASPLSVGTKAFKGANNYTADDIPEIDFLFITHDHWDHLDYDTIKKIKPKVKQIITGLRNR